MEDIYLSENNFNYDDFKVTLFYGGTLPTTDDLPKSANIGDVYAIEDTKFKYVNPDNPDDIFYEPKVVMYADGNWIILNGQDSYETLSYIDQRLIIYKRVRDNKNE